VSMSEAAHEPREEPTGRAYLWILAFTLPALLGYAIYGLHPERLATSQMAMRFYPMSFQLFAQLHILVSAAVLFAVLFRRLRFSWLPALGAVALISFTAEHVGTGYGVPFGGYGYTGLLGLKVGGRVPALIPVSWFLMALPAWVMTRAAFPGAAQRVQRVAVGAAWLVAWDLALDPAMSYLTAYWRWEESGPYYGMPWLNLLGWFITGVVLMGALEAVATRVRLERLGARWALGYYLAVLSMPLGMLLAAGEWLAIGVTAAGVGSLVTLTEWARSTRTLTFKAPSTVEAVEA